MLDRDVNNKTLHDFGFSKMWVGSVIIRDKLNFEVTS